jgi:oligoendopeptidase F
LPNNRGTFVEKSSVGLRTVMKTSDDEATRKAAWEGLRALGPFVVGNGFCEMVKLRNAMARKLGYEDFYDYKVTQAEGFSKKKLFSILDTLLEGSKDLLTSAREKLAADKGAAALEGWNTGFMMAGDVEKQLDPFFPFEHSVEQWGRCFAKMGISYEGACMTLDLLDRKGKYSNGFCHWPQPAWIKSDGSWQPSTTNFTSLADPAAVGSGKTALTTLMHEAGHAAHFANIKQGSPLFSQERAPTSVAYAENQSMFLDSLCGDAAWRARYARARDGTPLPWDIHEAEIRSTFPFRVFGLRAMLSVPYFEKALYELPDDQVTPAGIQALADKVEHEVQGGLAARPMLSVPHIISDEASCYYHGYVLAEMSVYQTRRYFLKTLNVPIVDNPQVGAALTESYWKPGNSKPFLDLVAGLTGAPLTGAAWLEDLAEDLEAVVSSEKDEYAAAVKAVAAAAGAAQEGDVDLSMRMIIKDGDALIADSENGGFVPACKVFADYVTKRFFNQEGAAEEKVEG